MLVMQVLLAFAPLFFYLVTANTRNAADAAIFSQCTAGEQGLLRDAVDDALDALLAVSEAISGSNAFASVGQLAEEDIRTIVRRYFGDECVDAPQSADCAYMRDTFTRIPAAMANTTFTCTLPSECSWPDDSSAGSDPWNSEVSLCPGILRNRSSTAAIQNDLKETNSSDRIPTWPALLHEVLHSGYVGNTRKIIDIHADAMLEMPDYGATEPFSRAEYSDFETSGRQMARGPRSPVYAQWIAREDTRLAVHNAPNYENFAVEVALGSQHGLLEGLWLPDVRMEGEEREQINGYLDFLGGLLREQRE